MKNKNDANNSLLDNSKNSNSNSRNNQNRQFLSISNNFSKRNEDYCLCF